MEKLLELIKQNLTYYTNQIVKEECTKYPEEKLISKQVFELMSFLTNELKHKNLLCNFDFDYSSEAIFDSIGKEPYHHKQEDYVLPFLHHLAIQDGSLSGEVLSNLIHSFLKKHENLLSICDVMILSTGATRAEANLRFAVNTLRKYKLIEERDPQYKRSLELTMLGILSLIFIKLITKKNLINDRLIFRDGFNFLNHKINHYDLPFIPLTTFHFNSLPQLNDKIKDENTLVIEWESLAESLENVDRLTDMKKLLSNFMSDPKKKDKQRIAIIILKKLYRKLWTEH